MPSESVPLTVSVTTHGPERAVVSVRGELDINTATMLHHQLAVQLGQGRRHLVLDLAQVPFMDSSGLTILIRAMKETRNVGGSLSLAAPTPPVRRILDLTGISLTIPLYADVTEALQLQPDPS
ncbi:STAS domain-containing protein [Streptacidiphilus sp. PAMC 29251]